LFASFVAIPFVMQHDNDEAQVLVEISTRSHASSHAGNDVSESLEGSLHVVVIVLGDLGRSPRMQYHALSLLEDGHTVSLVGYLGEELVPALASYQAEGSLRVVRFAVPKMPCSIKALYFVWRIVTLALWTFWSLVVNVRKNPPIDAVLVQNPPALPLLLVAWFFCWWERFRRGRKPALIIDWHNLGYSMLNGGFFQRMARFYERTVAPWADAHWTVTTAMRQFLVNDGGMLPAHALVQEVPDCPPFMFQTRPLADQHDILTKLGERLASACPRAWLTNLRPGQTMLTEVDRATGQVKHRRGRPALVTSSTSWTPDEDFGVLLQALLVLDDKIQAENSGLNVLVVVTGKGPQKTMYERQISKLGLRHVAITTLWLEPADYPRLLATADLGVSLHTSTSGLDLPMKVLDLFGCEVPVCAMQFACLDELVQDGVNGRVFSNSHELAHLLWELLSPLTDHPEAANHAFGVLQDYSAQLRHRERWSVNWMSRAWPVLERVTQGGPTMRRAAQASIGSPNYASSPLTFSP
jgi:beta-1,4-mannosyltransferase